uniref:SFRICE_002948 n=1 Tax=Spodoptera frugiperda TaxID=7108 RepID=A0A2H1V238_SPOFR
MLAVKNFFMPEKRVDSPRFSRMPEALMRSIRRRSLRVKRTKSLVLVNEKRKSGQTCNDRMSDANMNC